MLDRVGVEVLYVFIQASCVWARLASVQETRIGRQTIQSSVRVANKTEYSSTSLKTNTFRRWEDERSARLVEGWNSHEGNLGQ